MDLCNNLGVVIMNLPFTVDQFLKVFENYNVSVWPFQIMLNLLAIVMIILSFKKIKFSDKINSGILAFLDLDWRGVPYNSFFVYK
jgi:hypothetical protein